MTDEDLDELQKGIGKRRNTPPDYLTTTRPLFEKAGFAASSIDVITAAGIYITNAVSKMIDKFVPVLEYKINSISKSINGQMSGQAKICMFRTKQFPLKTK